MSIDENLQTSESHKSNKELRETSDLELTLRQKYATSKWLQIQEVKTDAEQSAIAYVLFGVGNGASDYSGMDYYKGIAVYDGVNEMEIVHPAVYRGSRFSGDHPANNIFIESFEKTGNRTYELTLINSVGGMKFYEINVDTKKADLKRECHECTYRREQENKSKTGSSVHN